MNSIFKIRINDIKEYTISTYLDKEEIKRQVDDWLQDCDDVDGFLEHNTVIEWLGRDDDFKIEVEKKRK